ncbi:MAG: hypothetical protein NW207_04555 [Cytophagales bacterium]|nr:hypothetical protein [Cytophagales bacterium]
MNKSTNFLNLLKSLLIIQTVAVFIYTVLAMKSEGIGLFQVFINDIMNINWNGQFNLDFSCYFTLSALWIMWRNEFSISSIIIAILAAIIGIMVFAPYLLFHLFVEKGDIKRVIIGNR